MAEIPPQIADHIWEILQELLDLINEASKTEDQILQQFGETEITAVAFESLVEIRLEATERYSQLTQALLRIATIQPIVPTDTLAVINNRINNLQNRIPALKRSIAEITQDWGLSS